MGGRGGGEEANSSCKIQIFKSQFLLVLALNKYVFSIVRESDCVCKIFFSWDGEFHKFEIFSSRTIFTHGKWCLPCIKILRSENQALVSKAPQLRRYSLCSVSPTKYLCCLI